VTSTTKDLAGALAKAGRGLSDIFNVLQYTSPPIRAPTLVVGEVVVLK
jgi:hypothetical protein